MVALLNFPNNPTGYSPTVEEADALVRILVDAAQSGARVVAVTDDAYFGLFFDDETAKESLFAKLAGAHENLVAIKLDGATKENYVWGLRVGFITYGVKAEGDPAPVHEALEKKTAGCVRANISNTSHIGQEILLRSMKDPRNPAEHAEKFATMKARALKVREVLASGRYEDAFSAYPFNSGYFMCIRLKDTDSETLRVHLLDTYGVGLIALGSDILRVAFSCIDAHQIEPLFDTIHQGVLDLKGR